MASSTPRRDSLMGHHDRQRSSIHNASSLALDHPSSTAPLPLPVTVHPTLVLHSSSKHGPLLSFSIFPPALVAAARRFRVRPSLFALLGLLSLAIFCILHQHLNDRTIPVFPTTSTSRTPTRYLDVKFRPRHRPGPIRPPKLTLAPDEELAAVIAFISALPSNALPESVDPTVPIDPDLVLEFDTRTPRAAQEVHQLIEDTWTRLPVVMLSKRYSSISREIKGILLDYNLRPSPAIFEIDDRADKAVLTPILYRLTAEAELPILLLGGRPVGSVKVIRELHKSGQLRTMLAATGAIIDGAKKKKGKHAVAAAQ